jgi:Cof subfamily protein (haloacid dehalogenase superfamily)
MYKAIFIDIDGTLIKSDHTLSPATRSTLQKLQEKNLLVVLVSARPLSAILPIVAEAGLLQHPVASLNGAFITTGTTTLFESVIDAATVYHVHRHIQKYKATPIYYEEVQWYAEQRDHATEYEQRITTVPITIQPFSDTWQNWQNNNSGPNKIQVIAKAPVISEIQSCLQQQFPEHLGMATSKSTYLEIMNVKASKLNALKLLIGQYNISKEETIAIGDNFNDLEMIEYAGMGVAMGNAPEGVKARANYITDTNNNDGVSRAITTLVTGLI